MSPPAQKARPPAPRDDHARDRGIALPIVERRGDGAHHAEVQRIEGLGPVEREKARAAASFHQNLGLAHRFSWIGDGAIRRRAQASGAGRSRA